LTTALVTNFDARLIATVLTEAGHVLGRQQLLIGATLI
jgi:hypothetical protein